MDKLIIVKTEQDKYNEKMTEKLKKSPLLAFVPLSNPKYEGNKHDAA